MLNRLEEFDSQNLQEYVTPPRIRLMGVGGAGNNILRRLHRRTISGTETIALNTDAIQLNVCQADRLLLLGKEENKGRGTGGRPQLGRRYAEDERELIKACVEGADLVFVIAAMGGGTGTGAAPVIARIAREADALVVGVSILPQTMEGKPKRQLARDGLEEFRQACNCVIELDNQLLQELRPDYPFKRAYDVMSDLVADMVQTLTETVTVPSTINVDFADLKRIIEAGGSAKVLFGEASSPEPADVLNHLLGNPLLNPDFQGAEAALLHITAGTDFALSNCHEIMAALRVDLARDVNLILGYRTDETLDSRVRVVMMVSAIPNNVNGDGYADMIVSGNGNNGASTASVLGDTIPMVG
ncbi:MAG: cell division FtsZ family protein [Candidatus Poseidoniia archaeon]|jgi:cell division protein FtsZ|nr:cell division FtsZ family protein [Candidatus Poseidoniia archaeon]|tara:strand:- start:21 stop:1094 length:1074 start_codon:yes stop_codon:yes gene_type:complete